MHMVEMVLADVLVSENVVYYLLKPAVEPAGFR